MIYTKDIEIKLMEVMIDIFEKESINNVDAKWIRDDISEALVLIRKLNK